MVESRYEYVRQFEQPERLLPQCYMVVRLDGSGFTKFCEKHCFAKPNDDRGLRLMVCCTMSVMNEVKDLFLGYTESDEVSLVFSKDSEYFNRRREKIVSSLTLISVDEQIQQCLRVLLEQVL